MQKVLAVAAGLAWLVGGSAAYAGSVKKISAKKGLVQIELDEDETVEKDTQICIYDANNKSVGCGAVGKVKGTAAIIKMDLDDVKKVKAGMTAKKGDGDAAATSDDGDKPDKKKATAKKGKKKKKKGDDDDDSASGDDDDSKTSKTVKAKKAPFRVWAYYGAALATPGTYNKIGYTAPTSATPTSLWASDSAVKNTLVGFNLQLGIPLGAFSINPGVRYRKFTPTVVDADYDPEHENPYVSTSETATAIGFWLDFQVFHADLSKTAGLNITTGLDVDQSSVTLSATKKDDTGATAEGPVASATSKLTVESLRLGASFDLLFAKPLGLSIGVVMMKPLAASEAFSGSLEDSESRGLADPGSDLKAALGHQKNSLAFELDLGAVLAF